MSDGTHGHATRETLLSMSGLAFMEGIHDGILPRPPMAGLMGFGVTKVSDGAVAFEGAPPATATNPMGGVHGGWYGAILDSAMGCAVMTKVPQGSVYTTLEYKVNLTRAIPVGLPVRATATVQHAGRSTATAVAELRGVEDGKLYASGSTTCIIMAMKAG